MNLSSMINQLKKKISQKTSVLDRIEKEILKIKEKWKKGYFAAKERQTQIDQRIVEGRRTDTNQVKKWAELNQEWREKGEKLTEQRDRKYEEQSKIKSDLEVMRVELAKLMERERIEKETTDNVVNQVFLFRNRIVSSLEEMNAFLNENVYEKLVGSDGKLRSQLTIENSDGTKRVVAMVNSISKVDPVLAAEALIQINAFFKRILPKEREMDEATDALYKLTQKILFEKTSFKVGPELYRFLSLDLNEDVFPELVKAQKLLKRSLRSEKTNTYIKLYERKDRSKKFVPVKLSA